MKSPTLPNPPINSESQWKALLQKWSDQWLSTQQKFPPSVRRNGWLGYKPATEKQIAALEKRLGYRLPPSFRTFLLLTNGWRRTATFIQSIRKTTKTEWLQAAEPDFIEIYDQFNEACFGSYGGLSRGAELKGPN
jgi:hypothetical protein